MKKVVSKAAGLTVHDLSVPGSSGAEPRAVSPGALRCWEGGCKRACFPTCSQVPHERTYRAGKEGKRPLFHANKTLSHAFLRYLCSLQVMS